jgi:hypothetical protein
VTTGSAWFNHPGACLARSICLWSFGRYIPRMSNLEGLIEDAYVAALRPERWSATLTLIAGAVDGHSARAPEMKSEREVRRRTIKMSP